MLQKLKSVMAPARSAVIGLIALVMALSVLAVPAQAHSSLVDSSPGVDEVLEASPPQISLIFNENLIALEGQEVNLIQVTDQAGKRVDLEDYTVVGAEVTVSLQPNLPPGSYLVEFRVLSADGHPISERFSFEVLTAATTDGAETPSDLVETPGGADSDGGTGQTSGSPTSGSSTSSTAFIALGVVVAILAGSLLLIRRSRKP